jgi:cytochrome bd-type quinol oxidase subunit 2
MSYQVYNLLHILGIVLVFMAIGAAAVHAANGGDKASNKMRGLVMAFHGTGLVLLLVAGFGMLSKKFGMANGLPGWLHPKLLIWVLLGAAPTLIMRKPDSGKLMWFVVPLLGAAAAYFGINH